MSQPIRRICFTGPESSGKSTLAQQLAVQFDDAWVPEFARVYLEGKTAPYTAEDLLKITLGQLQMEEVQATNARQFLFCDTGPLVLKVWAEEKFGACPPLIQKAFQEHRYHLYVLCQPDIPWEPDPLRENPSDRERLFRIYQQHLDDAGFDYVEVAGKLEQRMDTLTKLLNSKI